MYSSISKFIKCYSLTGHVLQGIAAKSVAPITGAPGPLVAFAYVVLALGLPGTIKIPAILKAFISPVKCTKEKARKVIERESIEVDAVENLRHDAENFYRDVSRDVSADGLSDGQVYANEVALRTLQNLLLSSPEGSFDAKDSSVVDLISVIFPQLALYMRSCQELIVDKSMRPLFAHLASKALKLWSRELSFTLLPHAENLTNKVVGRSDRTVTLSEIVEATRIAQAEVGNSEESTAKVDVLRQTLADVMECETRIKISRSENAATGTVAGESNSFRFIRKSAYTIDLIGSTSAGRRLYYHGEKGHLGICEKDSPKCSFFTPGIMTYLCGCPFRVLLRYENIVQV